MKLPRSIVRRLGSGALSVLVLVLSSSAQGSPASGGELSAALTSVRTRLASYADTEATLTLLDDVCTASRRPRAQQEARFLCASVAWDLYLLAHARAAISRTHADGGHIERVVRVSRASTPRGFEDWVEAELRAVTGGAFASTRNDILGSIRTLRGPAHRPQTGSRTLIAIALVALGGGENAEQLLDSSIGSDDTEASTAWPEIYAASTRGELSKAVWVRRIGLALSRLDTDDPLRSAALDLSRAIQHWAARLVEAQLAACFPAASSCVDEARAIIRVRPDRVAWATAGTFTFDGDTEAPLPRRGTFAVTPSNQAATSPLGELCDAIWPIRGPHQVIVRIEEHTAVPVFLRVVRSLRCAGRSTFTISAGDARATVQIDNEHERAPRVDVRLGGLFISDPNGASVDIPRVQGTATAPYDLAAFNTFLDARRQTTIWVRVRDNVRSEGLQQLIGALADRDIGLHVD